MSTTSLLKILITTLLLAAFSSTPVQASETVYRVSPNGIDSGDCGATWENACSLTHALSLSTAGDQIWVSSGTYKPTSNNDRTISFSLVSGVALYGGFAGSETELTQRDPTVNVTVLSGDIGVSAEISDNSYHVVYSNQTDASTILDGFTIEGGNADGSYPYSRGGGVFNYKGNPQFANLIITENSAIDLGGGVYNFESAPSFSNISFLNNSSENRGGGIYNYTSNVTMSNITFDENYAKDLGAGMNCFDSQTSLTDSVFTNNIAESGEGGGLFSFGGMITVTNAYFSGNSAVNGAGMYNTWYSDATLNNVSFENNSASERAGGFYNYLSNATLTDVTFLTNTAQHHGGGMFTGDSDPVLQNVTFTGNTSEMNGGGFNVNASDPKLTDVTFIGNKADNGGGIYIWDYSSPTLENVEFQGNTATFRGGGMFGVTGSNFVLNNVTFTANSAQEFGGGVFSDSSTPVINNVAFLTNTAQQRGGGLYLSGSPSTITNTTFSGNSSYDGGGLFANDSDSTINNVTFSNNTSQNRGGGLYNYLSKLSLQNITFNENYTKTYGGGYFNADGPFTITNGTFSANRADVYGGAITSDESSAKIFNSIFWGNSAGSSGNQIYIFSGGVPVIKNSVIEKGCPSGATCTNIVTADPLLGKLGDNGGFTQTIALLDGSSAIEAGSNDDCPSVDQRGISRPQGSYCDIGAYEVEGESIGVIVHSPADDEKLTTSKVTFEWDAIPNATKYIIRLSTDSNFSTLVFKTKTINTSFAFDEFLKYDQTYYWQICPLYGLERGAWSPVFWFQSMDPLEAPNLLTPIQREKILANEVTFSWTSVLNGVKYKILVATDPAFVNKVLSKKTSELTISGTLNAGKYYWRVRTFDSSGRAGPWSKVQIFRIAP